jgi:hypothetical protein
MPYTALDTIRQPLLVTKVITALSRFSKLIMKNLKYVGLAFAASLVCVILWFHSLPSHAAQPRVQLQTDLPLSQAVPNETPIQITLQAVDVTGKPLSNAQFQLELFTPAKTPWFTSDFPIVEGTQLLELSAKAVSGKLEFEQVMPIRGNYTLKVQVIPLAGAFEPFEQLLQLSVPERFVKYKNAAILIGILILTGVGSGWIIGEHQIVQDGEIAPQSVRLLLSAVIVVAIAVLLFVNISAEFASAHSHGHTQAAISSSMQHSQDLEMRLSGDQQATVGQLASQTIQVVNAKTGNPEANVAVNAKTTELENDKPIFVYQGRTDDQGKITWNEQFFDGAPHQVIAEATLPNKTTLQVSHKVEVEGIAPPLHVRLISLGYYTGIFVLSLLTGIWLHRRSSRSVSLSLKSNG